MNYFLKQYFTSISKFYMQCICASINDIFIFIIWLHLRLYLLVLFVLNFLDVSYEGLEKIVLFHYVRKW